VKEFHAFRLDTVSHRLWRGQERVSVTPKAFDLLRYLVEHHDRLVTQDEILEALWPDTHVNPEVVKKYILEIRKALGDRSDQPAFIETFPKRGYQFVAPVRDATVATPPGTSGMRARETIVGRDAEMAQLERSLEKASRGERQILFVTGEAGVGKTTLVDAFHGSVADSPNLRIARGQCVEGFGGKEAYYPLLEAFGGLIRHLRGRDGDAVVRALAQHAPTWLIQFHSLIKAEQREALQREVLGTTRERMVREICEALEALTTGGVFVLILEDLHWSDLSTLDVLSALARRRVPAKLMVAATYRPGDVVASESPLKSLKQDLLIHDLCQELALERLREDEIAEFLAAEFAGHRFPAGLARLIHRHSDGNALFMTTIVHDMMKRGLIEPDGTSWALAAPLEEISPVVPETLQRMLELHFEQLTVPEQQILKSASVSGERFSVWEIADACEIPGERIEELCEALANRQRFIRAAGLHELADGSVFAHYEFRHSLYRQVVYRLLSDRSRSRLHRIVGERLRSLCTAERPELAAEVALHLERGREYGDAIDHLILAAENAASRFAYRESIELLKHALLLVPKVAARNQTELELQLLEHIGDAHYWLGSMSECAKAYEAGAARAAEAGLTSAQVRALSCLVRPFGLIDPDRGIAAVERAERLSASASEPLLHAQTELLAAGTRLLYDTWRRADWQVCESAHRTIQRLSDSGLPGYHRMIYAHLHVLQGRYREALEELEAGIPKVNEPTSWMAHLFAISGKTVALLHWGRFGELMQILHSGRQMAAKNGNDPWLFAFREGWLRTVVLDFDGARRLCEEVSAAPTEYPTAQPQTIARLAAGQAALESGRYDEAGASFRHVLDPERTPKFFLHWYWRMNARLGLCNVWLASGRHIEARREADGFLDAALSTDDPNLQALAWEAQARVAAAEEDWKTAHEDIQRALAVLERFEIPTVAWRIHATGSELYRRAKDGEAAEVQRAQAEALVRGLATSFGPDESLGDSLLAAARSRGILRAEQANGTAAV
jgi:DNA-binding winged helix-turn-helix (wHTH) protein/tetratricopeptide (TPR) repeat protein